jgi:hypothetical protein
MSHAFVGVLTCARIHSIELDRERFPISTTFFFFSCCGYSDVRNSGRGRGDEHVWWHRVAHATRGVPRLGPDRRRAHRVRVRHQCEQGRKPRPSRVFCIYALVGEAESLVRLSFGGLDGWMADGGGVNIIGLGSFYWECRV